MILEGIQPEQFYRLDQFSSNFEKLSGVITNEIMSGNFDLMYLFREVHRRNMLLNADIQKTNQNLEKA